MEITIKVIKPFRDKHHRGILRPVNKELHVDKERAEELIEKGLAEAIEIQKEVEKKQPEKKQPEKKQPEKKPPEKKPIEIETATIEPESEKAVPEKKKTAPKKKKKEE